MGDGPHRSVSVAGVVIDDAGRVLLVRRRDDGRWQPPGGVLEIGEMFADGVAREVLEETGVRVEVDHLTGVYHHLRAGVVALVYRCHAVGGAPIPTEESSEVAWVDMADALARMPPVFAVRVRDAAVPRERGAASRDHDGVRILGE